MASPPYPRRQSKPKQNKQVSWLKVIAVVLTPSRSFGPKAIVSSGLLWDSYLLQWRDRTRLSLVSLFFSDGYPLWSLR